jgi:hypothetical protein
MAKVIAIYWNHDSNELRDLPDVKVVTCGSDGMEVLGNDVAIAELHEAVKENPDKFTLADGPRVAKESDFVNAVTFSQGNWPEFDTVNDVKQYIGLK